MREEISSHSFEIAGNESSKSISIIDDFIRANNFTYQGIDTIICVNGPGSFTGIRTISLVVNTLSFIYPHISLTSLSFFDLYDSYPIAKASSKRDLFVKYKKWDIIQIQSNITFEEHLQTQIIYGDMNQQVFTKPLHIIWYVDYNKICKNLKLRNDIKIAPLYIKKPNIS